jgi:hypothetical protein
MGRYRAIYDKHGKACEYVNNELVWTREGVTVNDRQTSSAILPDIPDFISPIDGTIVSGRAGMRDHCARHNVVPTADLAGLPPRTMVTHEYDPKYREQTKRTIAEVMNSRTYPRK